MGYNGLEKKLMKKVKNTKNFTTDQVYFFPDWYVVIQNLI